MDNIAVQEHLDTVGYKDIRSQSSPGFGVITVIVSNNDSALSRPIDGLENISAEALMIHTR
jgi:hypothetical protein